MLLLPSGAFKHGQSNLASIDEAVFVSRTNMFTNANKERSLPVLHGRCYIKT